MRRMDRESKETRKGKTVERLWFTLSLVLYSLAVVPGAIARVLDMAADLLYDGSCWAEDKEEDARYRRVSGGHNDQA